MLNENFVIVGFIIVLIGGLTYIIDTLKGKVKPNRVSWFLWALAPLIAFSAEVRDGVGIQSLMTFGAGFIPLLVFIASFVNKKANWKLGKLDLWCGAFSIIGIILWYITKIGNVAIVFSIISDALASIPTLIKSFYFPQTEDYKVYLYSAVSAVITLLTIKIWNIANAAFPIYILVITLLVVLLIKRKELFKNDR